MHTGFRDSSSTGENRFPDGNGTSSPPSPSPSERFVNRTSFIVKHPHQRSVITLCRGLNLRCQTTHLPSVNRWVQQETSHNIAAATQHNTHRQRGKYQRCSGGTGMVGSKQPAADMIGAFPGHASADSQLHRPTHAASAIFPSAFHAPAIPLLQQSFPVHNARTGCPPRIAAFSLPSSGVQKKTAISTGTDCGSERFRWESPTRQITGGSR